MKTPSCAACRAALPQLLDAETSGATKGGFVTAPQAASAAAHLAGCPECQREFNILSALRASSRSIGVTPAPANLQFNVRAALAAEARKSQVAAPAESLWQSWTRRAWRPRSLAWSGSAAVAAFVLLLTMRTPQPLPTVITAAKPQRDENNNDHRDSAAAKPATAPKFTAPSAVAPSTAAPNTVAPSTVENNPTTPERAASGGFSAPQSSAGIQPRERITSPNTAGTGARQRGAMHPNVLRETAPRGASNPFSAPHSAVAHTAVAPAPHTSSVAARTTGARSSGAPAASETAPPRPEAAIARGSTGPGREKNAGNSAAPSSAATASATASLPTPSLPTPSLGEAIENKNETLAKNGIENSPIAAALARGENADSHDAAPQEASDAMNAGTVRPAPFARLALLPREARASEFAQSQIAPGALGPAGPFGPRDVPQTSPSQADADESASGFAPPSGVFGFGAPRSDTLSKRSADKNQRANNDAASRQNRAAQKGKDRVDEQAAEARLRRQEVPPRVTVAPGILHRSGVADYAENQNASADMASPFALDTAVAPIASGETRRALLLLVAANNAPKARVRIVSDGLVFPNARDGIVWQGAIHQNAELRVPVELRATRAGLVNAQIILETNEGTILSQETVELFAAP